MRVIAGTYKGRLLKMPKISGRDNAMLLGIRPTQDRVKEAMFEILKDYLADTDVLDLFAGSGALGIEALSRGAKSAVFVERHPLCVKTICENLDNLKIGVGNRHTCSLQGDSIEQPLQKCPSAVVMKSDIFKAIKYFNNKGIKFGILIADPPYGMGMPRKLLIKLDVYDILIKPFLILIQHSKKDSIPKKECRIVLSKQYNYGDTVLSVYRLVVNSGFEPFGS